MDTVVETTIIKSIKEAPELYDEDGYLIASLEEGIADYKAGRVIKKESWEEMMQKIQWEIDNGI